MRNRPYRLPLLVLTALLAALLLAPRPVARAAQDDQVVRLVLESERPELETQWLEGRRFRAFAGAGQRDIAPGQPALPVVSRLTY